MFAMYILHPINCKTFYILIDTEAGNCKRMSFNKYNCGWWTEACHRSSFPCLQVGVVAAD